MGVFLHGQKGSGLLKKDYFWRPTVPATLSPTLVSFKKVRVKPTSYCEFNGNKVYFPDTVLEIGQSVSVTWWFEAGSEMWDMYVELTSSTVLTAEKDYAYGNVSPRLDLELFFE